MEHHPEWARPLAWCLHALGLLLFLAPLLDLAAGVGSVNPGEVPWRFGAVGLLSGALVLPMVGIGLILIASVVLEQFGLTRTIGVIAILILLGILGLIISFGLDSLQVRAQLRQEAKRAFDLATIKAVATYLLEAFVLVVVARNALAAARIGRSRPRARRDGGTLVVPKGDA